MNESTRFGMLRHGQTVWNKQRRIQGRLDSELTTAGKEAGRQWGRYLASERWNWRRIITSPAPRAWKTAIIINEFLDVEIEEFDDLREQDWGLWEGLTRPEIEQSHKRLLQEQIENGWSFRPPEGESRREVCSRAHLALTALGRRFPGDDILIISHQGVIKSLVYSIENREFQPDEHKLIDKNTLQTLIWNDHDLSAEAYNIVPS